MAGGEADTFPDGVREDHADKGRGWDRHSSVVSLLILTAMIVVALSGLLGGRPSPVRSVRTPAATLAVKAPEILRNGMFFETEIRVTPRRPVAKLVVAVDETLWRDFTVNTMIPAAAEESFGGGRFHFDYGPAEPDKAIVVKIDSQINPSLIGTSAGTVAIYDGETQIAALPLTIQVRP